MFVKAEKAHLRLISSLFVAIFFVSGCATVPVTGRRQVSFVSQQLLVEQSSVVYNDILKEAVLVEDTKEARLVRDVGGNIAQAAEEFMLNHGMRREISYFNWEFNLIEGDEVINAFCLPGGKVAIYTGMLKVASDEDSLAVVIGHEAAHLIANHGNERMSQQLLANLGQMTLQAALQESPERTQELWMRVYGIGSTVGLLLPYSRRQEKEADHIGLIITAMAGYDPNAALDLWLKMKEMQPYRSLDFLSTHPAPGTRIEYIKRVMPEAMRYYSGVEAR